MKQSQMRSGVYLLGSKEHGWYKIGQSDNVARRVKEISSSYPFAVELIAVWRTQWGRCRTIEAYLHTVFADKRINGEWFRLDVEEVEHCVSLMTEMTLPMPATKYRGATTASHIACLHALTSEGNANVPV